MMAQIKPVLACASTAGLCGLLIIVLDTITGVPFNYAVPLALILSFLPYAFWLRAHNGGPTLLGIDARADAAAGNEQSVEPPFEPRRSGRRSPRGSKRPATIHSIIFTPMISVEARRGGSIQEA
jgi:hypothetical protein